MLCKNVLLRYALQERPASVCSARTSCFGMLCKNVLLRYALQEHPASIQAQALSFINCGVASCFILLHLQAYLKYHDMKPE
ncbi:hypothetical protein H6P81_016395 [Aristolochia fimbriata]|uniref:Uncharacterized protein n=1 Tax=Aristolochia fimbriata TaxID=158543 RepID=A0AAV7E856_ARIFI|nr:hypothetical protein H6P81_016395 [Aristolochia fimbriata]